MFNPEAIDKPAYVSPDFGGLLEGVGDHSDKVRSRTSQAIDTVYSPLKECLQSVAYSGIAEPIIAVSQVVESLPGCKFLRNTENNLAAIGLKAPDAPTNWLESEAQQWGSAAGSMVPFLVMHKFVRAGFGAILDEKAGSQIAGLATASKVNFGSTLAREASISFITGMFCGSAFKASDPHLTGTNFAKARLMDGLTNGATMATLTTASFGLGRLAQSEAIGSGFLKTALTHPISGGALSAVPAGLVQSEMAALSKGQALPSRPEAEENIYQMAKTGVVFGAVHSLGLKGRGLAPYTAADNSKALVAIEATEPGKGATAPQNTRADAYRKNPITDVESPLDRATRLNLPKDMERSKSILFGKVTLPDGSQSDVVIRPFTNGAKSEMRVYRAGVSERVGQVIKNNTGIESSALPMVLRDTFTFPDMTLENFDWTKTTTEPAIVQENGGKPLGMQLRDWSVKSYGAEANGEAFVGSYSRMINENPEVRSLMGRAVFDNMFKGNIDLVEFSQQTIPAAGDNSALEPSRHLSITAIDNKNDFTNLDAPSWGFGAQFGMPLEVAKTFEGKRLAWADPTLQGDSDKLLSLFTSEGGKSQLISAGLTPLEVEAAGKRLDMLSTRGFPLHLGEDHYYGDDAKTLLTASLTSKYDVEASNTRKYLEDRDANLKVKTIDGKLVIVRGSEN